MTTNAIPMVSMRWTPAGKMKRGRPKLTWRRSVKKRIERGRLDLEHKRSLMKALCDTLETKRIMYVQ